MDSPHRLYETIMEIFTPKPGELERVLTKEELIELCKHKKCRVEMDRWNPVYQFYKQLKRKGRLNNKDPIKIRKLLTKLGNRYKNDPLRSYPQHKIEEERKSDFELRKCWNVRWLDENKKNSPESQIVSQDSSGSLLTINTQSQGYQTPPRKPHKRPTYMNLLLYNPASLLDSENLIADSEQLQHTQSSEEEENNNEKDNSLLQLGDDVIDLIETETDLNVVSLSEPALLFEGNSENYESFHVSIPVTSTQSQERTKH